MSVTHTDLNNFHEFATAKLNSDRVESMHELLDLWLLQNPPEQEQIETVIALREGLADIEAGRVHDFEKVNAEIRKQHGWSNQR